MNGPIAKYLELDKKTGVISLGNYSVFDREKLDFHFLTVEARDDLGRGNRNTVELLIKGTFFSKVKLSLVISTTFEFSRQKHDAKIRENCMFRSTPNPK